MQLTIQMSLDGAGFIAFGNSETAAILRGVADAIEGTKIAPGSMPIFGSAKNVIGRVVISDNGGGPRKAGEPDHD